MATLGGMARFFDFQHAPGHLIRRAHQRAVAVFMEETAVFDVTPVQFAIVNALIDTPGVDQVTLAARVALDAATSGSVIGRLEARGWLRREVDAQDKRRRLLWVTPAGEQAAHAMKPAVARVQERLLAPLTVTQAVALQDLLGLLVDGELASESPVGPR